LFNEIAKENKNVALVGTQGEILQNKKLLVDALHTNAEGTAIYNQSVIDAMSQFKNDVPSSTPDAIKQVQTSNVVATTPAQITQIAQTGQSMPVIPTARGRVIEGDNIDEQIAALPELMYQTRTNPNNPAIWETYNPKTGEIIDTGVFEGGGDRGLLAASRPVLALAASVLGAPYLSNLIAGATPLTGSALAGATGATIAGGTTALTGGSAEETLRAALLGGGGAYAGSALNNYLTTGTIADPSITERAFATLDAKQLAEQGLTATQIRDTLSSGGYNDAIINRALTAITPTNVATTTPVAVSTPVLDGSTVAVTGSTVPSLNSVLNTIATLPNAGTVQVAAPRTPEQVNQDIINLANSQIQSNVTTPTNLQTPEQVITSSAPTTTQQVINAITAAIPTVPAVTTTTPVPPEVQITAPKTPTTPIILPPVTTPVVPVVPPVTPVKPPVTPPVKETDPIKVAQLALAAAGLLGAGSALSTNTPTGFDIVPIPADWKTPPKTGVAPFTPLPPIDFGTRNLLMGTQWEKFLDPNYGKVPEPVQYSQPSNMSYNDLMSILGSKQGMPSASSLSINDIISGIQNQYGQTPTRTMG
jgi:hypothetical protein